MPFGADRPIQYSPFNTIVMYNILMHSNTLLHGDTGVITKVKLPKLCSSSDIDADAAGTSDAFTAKEMCAQNVVHEVYKINMYTNELLQWLAVIQVHAK